MNAIRYLSWLFRAALFLLLLLFALKNTDLVTLRFFFSESWQVPLILLLLIFFAFGAAMGVLACLSRLLQERRKVLGLERELRRVGEGDGGRAVKPGAGGGTPTVPET